jgi:hypothetical protein
MKHVRTLIQVVFTIVFCAEMLLAAKPKVEPALMEAPVAIACMQRGDLSFLVLSPLYKGYKKLDTESIVPVGPTRPMTELKSYRDGDYIFFGSTADGTTWLKFGRSAYQKMLFMGKTAELNSFQQVGDLWACVIDDVLYQEVNGTATAIATTELRSYKAENGEVRRAQMTKRIENDDKWCFETGDGKVYLQEPSGKINHIGWMEWRVVSLPQSEKTLILMTKGINKNSKWSGKHGGKVYIEK